MVAPAAAYNVHSVQQHQPAATFGQGPGALDPAQYLGPSTGSLAVNPYDNTPVTNYSYPEAVKGTSLRARDDLTGFVLDNKLGWYTTVALPWAYTDQNQIHWNEWNFGGALADRVPHEGVSRLISTSKKTFQTHVVRRGLAFVMEGDYAATREGQLQYVQNVRSIAQSVQETQDHDTVWALLTCKNYMKMYNHLQEKPGARVPFGKIYEEEVLNYGAVNTADGASRLEVLIEEHKRTMKEAPDTLILSPGCQIYLSMLPPERIEYWKAGEQGVFQRELGPMSMGSIQGLNVFEARDFSVEEDHAAAIQLLTRPIQIAEFYPMVFDREDTNCTDYTSKEMGCYMYDENDDQFRKVTLLEAFNNSNLFDHHGHYSNNVHRYVESLNMEKRPPTPIDADTSNDPTLFLAAPGADNKWMAARYFGQMEMHHMTPLHVQRIAESMAAGISGQAGFAKWNSFMRLVTAIQGQQYDDAFFTALIAKNTPSSVSSDGVFVGEQTPADLAEGHGVIPQVQWTSNQFGSLDLPRDGVGELTLPPGYANGPGLRTLAAEANVPGSPWKEAGEKAQDAIDMISSMIEVMRQAMPSSAAFDANMRAPWFHRADALTTFLDGVIGLSDAPMFLANLPIVQGTGSANSSASASASGERTSAPWFVVPGTVYELPPGQILASADLNALVQAIETNNPSSAAGASGPLRIMPVQTTAGTSQVVFKTASGATVSLPPSAFANVVQYAPEVRALGAMPSGKSTAARDTRETYIDLMRTLADENDRLKLAQFVMLFSEIDQQRMWTTIAGLRSVDVKDQSRVINVISLGENPTRQETEAATAQIETLASMVVADDYANLEPIVVQWQSAFPTSDAGAGAFGYATIADDVQKILDIERELLDTASPTSTGLAAARAAYGNGQALSPATAGLFNALTASSTADATRFAEKKAELTAAAARVDVVLRAQTTNVSDAADSAVRRGRTMSAGPAGSASVVVGDDATSVASAAYYRSPLTVSRAMIESLSTRFAGGYAKPLVLPGDRSTAFTQPYGWVGDVDSARIPLGSALREDAGRMSSMTLSEIFSSDIHSLDETTLVRQLDMAGKSRVAGVATLGASTAMRDVLNAESAMLTAASAFGDDDDGAELSALASAGGRSYRSPADTMAFAMGGKRQRALGAGASAHGHHHSHDQDARERALGRVRTGAFVMRFKQTSEISDPVVRLAARVFLMGRMDMAATWRMMIEGDVIVPANFILARPSIVHKMDTFIMMKAGYDTGANFFGSANAGQNVDNVSKMIYYNFTFRSKAVVYNEKNVRLLENLKFSEYCGGHNTLFMRSKNDMTSASQERPSLISLATSLKDTRFGDVMDLAGRTVTAAAGVSHDGSYSFCSSKFYDHFVWHLSKSRTSIGHMLRSDYFERAERMTTLASVGAHYRYNRHTGVYNRFIAPKGHLKLNMAVPGGRPVMNGRGKTFPVFDYAAVQLT